MNEIKICQQCNKEITAEGRNKFCSAECQSNFYNKVKVVETIKVPDNKEIIPKQKSKDTIRTCGFCGKEYDRKEFNAKYCSNRCLYLASYKNRPIKKCETCGKEFHAYRPTTKYCSNQCCRDFYLTKNIKRLCVLCNKEFVVKDGNQKYCSHRCCKKGNEKLKAQRKETKIEEKKIIEKKVKEKIIYTKTCLLCGKEFEAVDEARMYCSIRCRNIANSRSTYIRTCPNEKIKKVIEKKVTMYTKTCLLCGKEFEAADEARMYCSIRCRNVAIISKIRVFTCSVCGKEFETKGIGRKYCSDECRNIRQSVPTKIKKVITDNTVIGAKKKYTKTCLLCGKEFEAASEVRMYCSFKCRNIANSHSIHIRTCPVCGKGFETKGGGGRRYCSDECRNIRQTVPPKIKEIITDNNVIIEAKEIITDNNIVIEAKEIRICINCGIEYNTVEKDQRFCSQECSQNDKQLEVKVCLYCGEEYETYSKISVYCSQECRIKGWNENNENRTGIVQNIEPKIIE